jgi:Zn-dependent peptidase ImmA (M78 family)
LKDVLFRGRVSDWREIQANKGMAALLMPRTLFVRVVRGEFKAELGTERPTLAAAVPLYGRLAQRFNVSKQALGIRLTTLGLLSDGR